MILFVQEKMCCICSFLNKYTNKTYSIRNLMKLIYAVDSCFVI